MEGSPAPELAVLASSAAQRVEAPGDANDTSGIRTASDCGGVSDDVSMTSHRAATTAAHIHCAIVLLRELGVSQPQSLKWGQVGSREAMVEPCLNTRDWGAFLPDWICPSLPPSSHRPSGRPRDRTYIVLCAPLSLLEWDPGSESVHAVPLSIRDAHSGLPDHTLLSLLSHLRTRLLPPFSPFFSSLLQSCSSRGSLGQSEHFL